MLLHIYGKMTIAKFKSCSLSYNWVVSFPPASIFNKTFKYEAEVDNSVVYWISSFLGYIESIYEWNVLLLIKKTSLIDLNVELKATPRGLFFSCRSFWINYASYEYKDKSWCISYFLLDIEWRHWQCWTWSYRLAKLTMYQTWSWFSF
jgi:hypothetical protein